MIKLLQNFSLFTQIFLKKTNSRFKPILFWRSQTFRQPVEEGIDVKLIQFEKLKRKPLGAILS